MNKYRKLNVVIQICRYVFVFVFQIYKYNKLYLLIRILQQDSVSLDF